MFNFFRRRQQREYVLIARYSTGDWLRRFVLTAASPYEAARSFDQSPEFQEWTRVSGATLEA